MNANEIRGKSDAEVQQLLHDLLKEQFNLRMQKGTGQLTRPTRMKEIRRDIARIKTVANEKKAGEAR
ncbi:MAG: 50S ribosomal protein L29 [Chromatiales bacterium]|jgi:large subunit ribosomal protein L29